MSAPAVSPSPVGLHTLHALEQEQALLGTLISFPETMAQALAVQPEDFFEGEDGLHATAFRIIREGFERGESVNLHALNSRLADRIETLGAPTMFVDMWDKAPPPAMIGAFVQEVVAGGAQRRLARLTARPGLSLSELRQVVDGEKARIDQAATRAREIRATAFQWVEPETLPARQWLYGNHQIRKFLSATFATGGSGKTSLLTVEALAMVTGKPLLGIAPVEPLKVWIVNLEDPAEETTRRVIAACCHYGIKAAEIEGRLFTDSGRDTPLVIARQSGRGVEIIGPSVQQIEREIRERQIDVMIVDPFVACHDVSENDNGAINAVARTWASIADRTGCAIELIHHVRKPSAGQGEITVDDGRGAGALLAAVRSARVLNTMSEVEASEWGIEARRSFFRTDNGKSNLAAPSNKATWRRLVSVDLENGPVGRSDLVAVVTRWEPPTAFDGVTAHHTREVQQLMLDGQYRADPQAKGWAGLAVAEVLGLDLDDKADKAKAKALLKTWLASGVLKVELRIDPEARREKQFVIAGELVET